MAERFVGTASSERRTTVALARDLRLEPRRIAAGYSLNAGCLERAGSGGGVATTWSKRSASLTPRTQARVPPVAAKERSARDPLRRQDTYGGPSSTAAGDSTGTS